MTTRVGRNDPCPCGSGKKYKKCCQTTFDETDFKYRRWRQVETGLIKELLVYALETYGPNQLQDAWREFCVRDAEDSAEHARASTAQIVLSEEIYPESPMNMVFMPWFFFNWIFEMKPTGSKRYQPTTVAASFLAEHKLSADEEEFLNSAILRPYSLCEVVELKPGVGMTLFDLLRRVKYEVVERLASQSLKKGEIIFCATMTLDGLTSNIGTSPFALRPIAKRDILELRKWMVGEIGSETITEDHLHEFAIDIRAVYIDLLESMFIMPEIRNTDNDPLVLQTIHFDIKSPDAAFHALKDLAEGVSEDDLLSEATLEDGKVVKAEFSWLGGTEEAQRRLGGPVLLGTIKIGDGKVVVSVNSARRAETIHDLLKERMGENITYKATMIEPIESGLQKMWDEQAMEAVIPGAERSSKAPTRGLISPDELPEDLRLRLEEDVRQYWIRWMDDPVPALNHMTPRQAAQTEEGRDLLESLLLYYENESEKSPDNITRPDVMALRRELGMDASRTRPVGRSRGA